MIGDGRLGVGYSADGLKRRLAAMERQIADLQRLRNSPQLYVEPEAAAGGITEAFAADTVGTTNSAIAASGTGNINWRVQSNTSGRFKTTGITTDLSTQQSTIAIPAGLWMLHAHVRLTAATSPTTGYADVYFSLNNEWVRIPWDEIVQGSDAAYAWIHRLYYFSTATNVSVTVDNLTDQSLTPGGGMFGGYRLAEYGDLTLA